jgi:uncharacterized cofD-like protein
MRVVGIGGGHGLAQTLRAARRYASEVSAVVTVADDGGSSGRLTAELGIPPPGDIRNCLVALTESSPLTELYQHRFRSGPLEGHALGNLIIAALADTHGGFGKAVEAAGDLLGATGSVYPATEELVSLVAVVPGGLVSGQVAVATTTRPITSVHLQPPEPEAHPGAVRAILEADQVVIGPGSLYTSVIAALLVPGIKQAVLSTQATRIYVCNSRPQSGEAETLDLAGHVEALERHVGPVLDAVVVQDPPLEDGVDYSSSVPRNVKLVEAQVCTSNGAHDPHLLGRVLQTL